MKKMSKKAAVEKITPHLEGELCGGCKFKGSEPDFSFVKHEEDKKTLFVQIKCGTCNATKIMRLLK